MPAATTDVTRVLLSCSSTSTVCSGGESALILYTSACLRVARSANRPRAERRTGQERIRQPSANGNAFA
eukprot:1195354-Prymnesium_polylepis.1